MKSKGGLLGNKGNKGNSVIARVVWSCVFECMIETLCLSTPHLLAIVSASCMSAHDISLVSAFPCPWSPQRVSVALKCSAAAAAAAAASSDSDRTASCSNRTSPSRAPRPHGCLNSCFGFSNAFLRFTPWGCRPPASKRVSSMDTREERRAVGGASVLFFLVDGALGGFPWKKLFAALVWTPGRAMPEVRWPGRAAGRLRPAAHCGVSGCAVSLRPRCCLPPYEDHFPKIHS